MPKLSVSYYDALFAALKKPGDSFRDGLHGTNPKSRSIVILAAFRKWRVKNGVTWKITTNRDATGVTTTRVD